MKNRMLLLTALLASATIPADIYAEIVGKRVDDGRTYMEFFPPSSERNAASDAATGSYYSVVKPASGQAAAGVKQPETAATVEKGAPAAAVQAPRSAVVVSGSAPKQPAAAVVARPRLQLQMGDASSGALFASGKDILTAAAKTRLDGIVEQLKGKRNLTMRVVGHTDNTRVGLPETLRLFGNNQRLSEARAKAIARYVAEKMGLAAGAVQTAGFGAQRPVADNRSAAGRARNRRAEIMVWYDDPSAAVPAETGVQPKAAAALPVQQAPVAVQPSALPPVSAGQRPAASVAAVKPVQPPLTVAPLPEKADYCGSLKNADNSTLPFRITVDGQPVVGDSLMPEADRRRCVDVALEKNDIQVRFDPLQAKPALNSWTWPDAVLCGKPVEFGAYSNYQHWIKAAEIRVFAGQRATSKPYAVIPAKWDRMVSWQPPADAPGELVYLLRVYDGKGRFDETALKPIRLLDTQRGHKDQDKPERERLTGWGQDSRRLATIPVFGGTVTVSGKHFKPGQQVDTLGTFVPIDREGKFAVRQILPSGPHTVTVAVNNTDGSRATFSRNLTIADQDWFYVAIADLTVGQNHTSGPAALVTGDSKHYDAQTYVDGRGAFYLKGLIKGEYLLTASADTSEQPVEDLFRNFTSKDPRYLLKRIDKDRYYPVYGDDSTLVEDAPTNGKFYVRLEKGDSHILWGNFQTQWTGNELTQFSRALYGAQLTLKTDSITSFGEKRASFSGFAAEPGTLQSRDEYRGTGGSLYYLRHLDLSQGSERVWVEMRDKDSGLVLERKQLVSGQDYEINYLQGRLLLTSPLSSVSASSSQISSGSVAGNPQYLVVTYEYVPGISAVDGYSVGLQGQWWVNDYLRLGLTGFKQGDNSQAQRLGGVDLTARYSAGSYIKAEVAESKGAGTDQASSTTGGFEFSTSGAVGERAMAKRIEGQFDLNDASSKLKGQGAFYWQEKEKGFSGPGELTPGEAETKVGGRLTMPVTKTVDLDIKADDRQATTQDSRSVEGAVRWQALPEWQLSLATRNDNRRTAVANASSTLSENGDRTDIQGRVHYKPRVAAQEGATPQPANWDLYGFLQGTAEKSGNRSDNNRAGGGGGWQATDRLRLSAEASGGDGGAAGLVGADYRISDRSNVYLKYVMETERPDYNYRGRYGTAVTGSKYKVSDEMSVYGETKATHGAGAESLVNAFGLDLAPNDRWTYGLKGEVGTISDPASGDLTRHAGGISAAYKKDKTKYAGSLEYRHEDGTTGERHVWLVRNSLSYQVAEDWRWFNKANFSVSRNTRGVFYDGDFVELVSGAAYRPVKNDRFNGLFKYTYYQDTPTAGQLTASSQTADYVQRSHVLSVDGIYDFNSFISGGGKVGYRYSQLKTSKTSGDWFDSHAILGIVRADLHLVRKWDALVEYRLLVATEADDIKHGFLTGIYYQIEKYFKVGVGYNFTSYSDNMTDLSYRSHGWFLNLIGKL